MKKLVLFLLFATGSAYAATAFLVGQRIGMSVTGQPVNICLYQYGGQTIERVLPMSTPCPMSIEVY